MRINLISDKNKSHGNDDTDTIFPEKQQVESSSKTAGTALVLCAEKNITLQYCDWRDLDDDFSTNVDFECRAEGDLTDCVEYQWERFLHSFT